MLRDPFTDVCVRAAAASASEVEGVGVGGWMLLPVRVDVKK